MKSIDQLDDGETTKVERVVSEVIDYRVRFQDFTMRALVKPGDKVFITVKASAYNERMYYWVNDWSRVQKEELPL